MCRKKKARAIFAPDLFWLLEYISLVLEKIYGVQSVRLLWLPHRKNEIAFFYGRLRCISEPNFGWLGKKEEKSSGPELLGLKHIHMG